MAYISRIKLPDGTIYEIKGVTYSLKLSDDEKTLTLIGSDGKTSSAAVNSGDSSGRKCRLNTSIDTLH